MDLNTIKSGLKKIKDSAINTADKIATKGAAKIQDSKKFSIHSVEELEKIISETKNINKTLDNGEEKEYQRMTIVIFAKPETDFYKRMIYMLPVIYTKSWASNIKPTRLINTNVEGLELSKYSVESLPSLVLFENTKVKKVIDSEEKILKLVKSFSMDIPKIIEEL